MSLAWEKRTLVVPGALPIGIAHDVVVLAAECERRLYMQTVERLEKQEFEALFDMPCFIAGKCISVAMDHVRTP